MTVKQLYCSVPSTSNIISASVAKNHDSPVASASIEASTTSLSLGDSITIDMGYTDDHKVLFTGYVKQVEKNVPNNTWTITAYDKMIRAQDYFIASATQEGALKFRNKSAESLVQDLMALAGLTDFEYTTTYFTFGINNEFEVNLVSVFDYSRMIADLLTWNLWSSQDGTINFKNRKPYVMTGDTGQPGDTADVPLAGYTLVNSTILDSKYTKSEKALRNRIVVYGNGDVHAEASIESPALPTGFYKTAVLAYPQLVDSNGLAQDIADYNLNLLHRITEAWNVSIIGDTNLDNRIVINTNTSFANTGNWYVFGCDHSWNSGGYTTNLELRRSITP